MDTQLVVNFPIRIPGTKNGRDYANALVRQLRAQGHDVTLTAIWETPLLKHPDDGTPVKSGLRILKCYEIAKRQKEASHE